MVLKYLKNALRVTLAIWGIFLLLLCLASAMEEGMIVPSSTSLTNLCTPSIDPWQSSELLKKLKMIQTQIIQAHDQADALDIHQAYEKFLTLQYDQGEWLKAGQALKVYQWSFQKTWKEAVGGELFYPKHAVDCIEFSEDLLYGLERRDWLQSFLIAAKFRHALGKFFLAYVIQRIRLHSFASPESLILEHLYKEALSDLAQSIQNRINPYYDDSCFILGEAYNTLCYKVGVPYEPQRTLKYHQGSLNPKNQSAAITLRERSRVFENQRPSLKDYENLNYKTGYLHLADILCLKENYTRYFPHKSSKEEQIQIRLSYLKRAEKQGSTFALIKQGWIYEGIDTQKAIALFEEAGKKGLSLGYLEAARLTLGASIYSGMVKYKIFYPDALESSITKAKEYYLKAKIYKDPIVWDKWSAYLIALFKYQEEQLNQNNDDKHGLILTQKELYRTLEEGIKLGSSECYYLVLSYLHYPDFFKTAYEKYGPPPQSDEFLAKIEAFLTN